uniref:Putative peptidase n=1 Tax=viral metagenome TaxID=1070528 RepID=A0A6M3KAR6_9ZZZZ
MNIYTLKSKGGLAEDDAPFCFGFSLAEVACSCCGQFRMPTAAEKQWLEGIRAFLDRPMIIKPNHRVFSCEERNREIQGAHKSVHTLGRDYLAVDFHIAREDPIDTYLKLEKCPIPLRIGLYKWGIHIDNLLNTGLSIRWWFIDNKYVYIQRVFA